MPPTPRKASAAKNFTFASGSSGFTKPVGWTWGEREMVVWMFRCLDMGWKMLWIWVGHCFFGGDVWKGCLGPRDGIAKIQMEEKLWPSYRNQSSTCTYLEGDRGATLMFWYVIAPCQTAFWELLFSHWCVVYDVNLNPVLAPSHEHPGLYILLIIENFPPPCKQAWQGNSAMCNKYYLYISKW